MKTPFLFLTTCALVLALPGVARAGHHGGGHHGGGHSSGHHSGGHSGSHHGNGHHFSHHSHSSIHYGHGYGFYGASLYGFSRYGYYRSPSYYQNYRGRIATNAPADSLASEVQVALAQRGYYRGPIDGIIGAGTRRALRAYQHDRDLPVSARIDRDTLDALGLS